MQTGRIVRAAMCGGVIAAGLALPVLAAETPSGLWLTEDGASRIRVAPCGKAMCATVVWAKTAGIDSQNPNPSLRGRSIVGLQLTRDMQPDGQGGWSGSIYNPEDGQTYSGSMKPKGLAALEVGGCVLGGLLCGSETWARQADDTASAAVTPRR